jgi:hypothetical protein
MVGFRYLAERAIMGNFKFISFDAMDWYRRMDDLSNGELSQNREELISKERSSLRASKIIKAGFKTLRDEQMLQLGDKYDCDYVVTEAEHVLGLEKEYGNNGYNLYRLKSL